MVLEIPLNIINSYISALTYINFCLVDLMNINIFQFLKQGTSLNRKSMDSNAMLES